MKAPSTKPPTGVVLGSFHFSVFVHDTWACVLMALVALAAAVCLAALVAALLGTAPGTPGTGGAQTRCKSLIAFHVAQEPRLKPSEKVSKCAHMGIRPSLKVIDAK